MKYKLMITDYDGTLGNINDISQENLMAIEKFLKAGGKFVICTGRSYKGIEHVCKQYNLKGAVICFQGAVICDIESGDIIYDGDCDKKSILHIKKELENLNLATGVYLDNYLHYDNEENPYLAYYRKVVGAKSIKVDNLNEFVNNTELKIRKLIAVGDKDSITNAQKTLSKEYNGELIVNTSADNLLEAVNPLNSKGESVKRIAKYFDIPLSQVITVGDSLNDIELIKGEWHGVAVGNAVEELKKIADEIAPPFCEHPIKYLIEKYI